MQNLTKFNRIRDLRTDADLSQKEMAKILGYHTTQYRRYESGESPITLEFAIDIATYFNVSLDYIAGRTNNKKF